MNPFISTMLEELDAAALEDLAHRLAPYLPSAQREVYLDAQEAAEFLGCTVRRIYDLTSQHRLTFYKDGSLLRFLERDLSAYLQSNATRAARS